MQPFQWLVLIIISQQADLVISIDYLFLELTTLQLFQLGKNLVSKNIKPLFIAKTEIQCRKCYLLYLAFIFPCFRIFPFYSEKRVLWSDIV